MQPGVTKPAIWPISLQHYTKDICTYCEVPRHACVSSLGSHGSSSNLHLSTLYLVGEPKITMTRLVLPLILVAMNMWS